MKPLRTVFNAFDKVFPYTVWVVFLGGLIGFIGTAVGLLPPFSDSIYGRILACLGWFLVTSEAYYELRDRFKEEAEKQKRSEGLAAAVARGAMTIKEAREVWRGERA